MSENSRIDEPTGTSTVGHEWDGIEELNTPLPRWWLLTFYACIIWALVYVVLYPAWPMISSATTGTLGWTSRGQLAQELKAGDAKRGPVRAALAAMPIEQLANDQALLGTAIEGGRAAFKVHCVQCHGSDAAGGKGYPNLNDDDWLWGGDLPAIHTTILHGIRNPEHAETRQSAMPQFDAMFKPAELNALVAYVQSLSGAHKVDAQTVAGGTLYANNCVQCHGGDGKGMRSLGAPNLTDRIWLYGGDAATIRTTIRFARAGVMPRWGEKLDGATVKMLAAYVHSLGGGEATPAATPSPAPAATSALAGAASGQ